MTSSKKQTGNRANAQSSTGPRTARGKARSGQNARKHGLSLPIGSDSLLSQHVEALVDELVGETANADIRHLARDVATAQIDLCRIQAARHRLLVEAMDNPDWDTVANQRAVARCAWTASPLTMVSDDAVDLLNSRPQGAEKLALILSGSLHQLIVLDRYERRAFARRKFAIRALDEARRLGPNTKAYP